MSARLGPHFSHKRTLTARFAVAGVAAFAAVVGSAPMAVAADDIAAADNGTTETIDPTPADPAPVDETPADETPIAETPPVEEPPPETPEPGDQEPAGESTAETTVKQPAPEAKSAAAVAAAVVADFGYNKFRVGVRIADGSTVPAGVTTLGSTITIVETGPGVDDDPLDAVEGSRTTTCTTTIDQGAVGTFCDNLNDIANGWDPALYAAAFGDVVTVTQTTVNAGLTIIDGVKTVVPTCNPQQMNCGEGDNRGDVILTDAPVPPAPPKDPKPDDEPAEEAAETLMLPDTGGSNAGLLAISLAMIGSGGWLIGKGRQPRRRSDALV